MPDDPVLVLLRRQRRLARWMAVAWTIVGVILLANAIVVTVR